MSMRRSRKVIGPMVIGCCFLALAADKPVPRVDPLPAGWVAKTPRVRNAVQFAEYPRLVAYFELMEEPRSAFSEKMDLVSYAKLCRQSTARKSKLTNRTETEVKAGSIGGRPIAEFEVTGELRGIKLHFRYISIQVGDWFCNVSCWTSPSHWEAAQPQFDEVVPNVR